MQGLISIEPYYEFSDNAITQIGTMRNDGIFEYTYENVGQYQKKGAEFNLTIPLHKNIIFQSGVEIFDAEITYQGKNNRIKDWNTSTDLMYVNQENGTVAGLEYQRNMFKRISTQGYNNNDNDYWLIFAQKPFFKKKLSVMLGYMIPTNFLVSYNQDNYIETNGYNKLSRADVSVLKNIFIFKLSYRFSKGKSIKRTNKNVRTESEDNSKSIF